MSTTKRFKVVTIHFTNKCNLDCPFCYKEKGNETMNTDLFLELPKYLTEITNQVAVGGGEPLKEPELLSDFASECKKHNLICNFTTNGHILDNMLDCEIRDMLKDITMISLSFDNFKIKTPMDFLKFVDRIFRLKRLDIELGVNLLVDKSMFENNKLMNFVDVLFKLKVDRVFVLYPKNFPLEVDITKHKYLYKFLTLLYKHFYVDDLTEKILSEGYDWKTPCHYGNDIINIDMDGKIHGCSFSKDALGQIKEAKDILKFKNLEQMNRTECPFLKISEVKVNV